MYRGIFETHKLNIYFNSNRKKNQCKFMSQIRNSHINNHLLREE